MPLVVDLYPDSETCPACDGNHWACGDDRHRCGSCGKMLREHDEHGRCIKEAPDAALEAEGQLSLVES